MSCEIGGSDDQQLYQITIQCLSDNPALIVTDLKGQIQFANSQLGMMVGYSTRVLTDDMNLTGLLPQPYSQLHLGLMKVCAQRDEGTDSCGAEAAGCLSLPQQLAKAMRNSLFIHVEP
jgi:hypothetical protein